MSNRTTVNTNEAPREESNHPSTNGRDRVTGPGRVTVAELRNRAEQAAVAFEATDDRAWAELAERYRAAAIARHRQTDAHSGACCPECGAPGDYDPQHGRIEYYDCPVEDCPSDRYWYDPRTARQEGWT